MHLQIKRFLISSCIGLLCFLIIFTSIDIPTLISQIFSLSINTIFFSTIIYCISLFLRSIRFWLLVNSVKGGIELRTSIGVTFSSYFLSIFIPARLGESIKLIRPKTKFQVPYATTGFSIIIEKIVDVFCITMIIVFSVLILLFFFDIELPGSTAFLLQIVLILEFLAISGLIIIFLRGDALFSRLEHFGKVGHFLQLSYSSYKDAMAIFLKKPTIIGISLFISLLIWIIDSIVLSIIFIQISGTFNSIVFLVTIISALFAFLTFIFPISPGNIGSYELAVSIVFITLLSVPASVIIGAALIEHGLKTLIHIVIGGSPTFYYLDDIFVMLQENQSSSIILKES